MNTEPPTTDPQKNQASGPPPLRGKAIKWVAVAVALIIVGYLAVHNFWRIEPNPGVDGFKHWLDGQQVVLAKGVVWDDKWTVKYSEITGLSVVAVERLSYAVKKPVDPSIYLAMLRFDCWSGSKGISGTAFVQYRVNQDDNTCNLVEFHCDPENVKKIGAW